MKKKILIVVGLIFVLLAAFLARDSKWYFENYVKALQATPSALISDFTSFQSVEDITNRLQREGKQWAVKSDSKTPDNGFRPEFNEYTISISEFADQGIVGILDLGFNNNRLYQTSFYPTNVSDYLKKLQEKYNVDLRAVKKSNIDKNTVIELLKDYQGRDYIKWSDEKIQNELMEWIKRFS